MQDLKLCTTYCQQITNDSLWFACKLQIVRPRYTVHVDVEFDFGERNCIEDVKIVYHKFAVEVCVMKTIAISHCDNVQIHDSVVVYEANDVGIKCE